MISTFRDENREKQLANRIYYWLLFSPFVTGSCYLVLESLNRAANGQLAWMAFFPLIFQAPLLFGLQQDSLYVRRHAIQAIGLAVLRAITAWLSLMAGPNPGDSIAIWFVVNGLIWFLGSLWGLNQVSHGECWLMRKLDPNEELPRSWAVVEHDRVPIAAVADSTTPDPVSNPENRYYRGVDLLADGFPEHAKSAFLRSFRSTNDPILRKKIINQLEGLGEVEKF